MLKVAYEILESEGVLMIITYDALVGYVNIIVFQLAIFGIVSATRSSEAVHEGCKNMLAFSVLAIPTRHEIPMELVDL